MEHNIVLLDQELDYIMRLLQSRPWGEVNPLIVRIMGQVNKHAQPPLSVVPTTPTAA